MFAHPSVGRIGILMRGWKSMFGRLSIFHRHDDRIGGITQCSGRGVVCVDGGNHPSAAVVVDNDGKRSNAVWGVYPNRNGAAWARNRPVLGFSNPQWRCALALSIQYVQDGIGNRWLIAGLLCRQRLYRFWLQ